LRRARCIRKEVGGVHKASLSDFIIFDAVLSYHVTLNSARPHDGYSSVVTSTLVTDSTRVTDRVAQFEHLWNAAG
jgi:hypothetical protein